MVIQKHILKRILWQKKIIFIIDICVTLSNNTFKINDLVENFLYYFPYWYNFEIVDLNLLCLLPNFPKLQNKCSFKTAKKIVFL